MKKGILLFLPVLFVLFSALGLAQTYAFCDYINETDATIWYHEFGHDPDPTIACNLSTTSSGSFPTADWWFLWTQNYIDPLGSTNRSLIGESGSFELNTDVNFENIPCSDYSYTTDIAYGINSPEGYYSVFCFDYPISQFDVSANDTRVIITGTYEKPAQECILLGDELMLKSVNGSFEMTQDDSTSVQFYYRLTGATGKAEVYINDVYNETLTGQTCGWSSTYTFPKGSNKIRIYLNGTLAFLRLGGFRWTLDGVHNYGIIKVLNRKNTRGGSLEEFDYAFGIQSIDHALISNPTYNTYYDNSTDKIILNVSWTSTKNMTSILQYQTVTGTGEWSVLGASVNNTPKKSHHLTAEFEPVTTPRVITGRFLLRGIDNESNEFVNDNTGNYFSFYYQMYPDLPDDRLCIKVENVVTGSAIIDAGIMCYDGICFDAHTPNYYINGSAYWCIAPELVDIGYHNLTINTTDYYPFNATFNVPAVPYIYIARLTEYPRLIIEPCTAIKDYGTAEECEANILNDTAKYYNVSLVVSWYCEYFEESETINDFTFTERYWRGFSCFGLQEPPPYAPINGSVTQYPTGETQLPEGAVGDAIVVMANLLGVSPASIMLLIAMIVSMGLATFSAMRGKSGALGVSVFVGMVVVFTVFGWIPIWITVILAIISAFIVAKFGTEMFAGK